jgi:uncharacterized repeat protein (TIGR02543 family)
MCTLALAVPAEAITPVHTVTYFENTNGFDTIEAFQISNAPSPLTHFSSLNPPFSNAGQYFVDWNTAADGSGVSFADGGSFSFASDMFLYAHWATVPVFSTVTFFENDSGSDGLSVYLVASSAKSLTRFADLRPSFVNSGHTFSGWNTLANGNGTQFSDGAIYLFASDLLLYAQWASVPVVTSSFVTNGGSGSIASVSNPVGSSTTLPTAAGVSKLGYTFAGWNTAADGSGTAYLGGATYVFTGDQTLYAQWTPDVYVVTYSSNGGSVNPATSNYTYATTGLILPTPTNSGYAFNGWFTTVSGGTLVGLAGASFTPSASVSLYAQWTPDVYVVTYSSNGGSVNPATSNYTYATTGLILPTPTNSGYAFNGWFTTVSGGTLVGLAGASFAPSGSVTLFAQWTQALTDTLTFDANGGSGSVASITGPHGSTITLPGQTGLLHAGFALVHWNTNATDTGTSYSVGQTLKLSGSSTLYAQWTGHTPAILFGAVGTFAKNSSALSKRLKNQVKRLALTIRAKKYHSVTLYGYTATTGLRSLNFALSRARATTVATYLRAQLRILKVKGVTIKSAGEGSVAGGSSAVYSRVEVFVV